MDTIFGRSINCYYAANVISDCRQLDAEQGYTRARKLLAEKYGNPHRASQQIQRELRGGEMVRSMKELDALSIPLRKCVEGLTYIIIIIIINMFIGNSK